MLRAGDLAPLHRRGNTGRIGLKRDAAGSDDAQLEIAVLQASTVVGPITTMIEGEPAMTGRDRSEGRILRGTLL